ncbi:glycoside hydrolase family 2 TIM barrel-domain containing protein [Enterococcus sp. AD013-P3]|uniref:glycoside hydrolase family 2 TIM barrel-domain containing protein n=1 Tax=Enterococcus sp. AD013-P3 TaxID=3411036 RepID=UPI003B93BBF2
MKRLFLDGWLFQERELQQDFSFTEMVVNEGYQRVEMPHDWLIYDVNNLYRASEGWYKKEFILTKQSERVYYLEFDGIYMEAEVYLNNQKIGEWKYGYTPLILPLGNLISGLNTLYVRVKHDSPNSRWYSGAGIYRNVWFHEVPQLHVPPEGQYLHSERVTPESDTWQLTVQTTLRQQEVSYLPGSAALRIELYKEGKVVAEETRQLTLTDREQTVHQQLSVTNPLLWSPKEPQLYELRTTLAEDAAFFGKSATDCVLQTLDQKTGFREIRFDSDDGLFLNGQHMKIRGVCQHHDQGALGAVANEAAIRRQLIILKSMGVNAIRTAHNPFSREFYQLADEMGFLVQSEFTDIWLHPKNQKDYSRFFDEWADLDVAAWIKRDRNHPSVFMWSIGNEIYDTHGREDGLITTKRLIRLVKKYDPLHNAYITFGSNYLLWENSQKAANLLEAVGYNYAEKIYATHHERYPDWVIYGSETCSVVQSRGVYHFPLSQSMLADDDYQCSALGNSRTSWGADSVERCILDDRDTPYSLGQFIWAGFDYIGEPTPYDTKNSYLGQIDTAGFPKDAYYTFQAAWTDYKEAPMIHLFPYWDFTKGQLIDVRVCSNAPEIELFFDGKSLGKRQNDPLHGERLLHDWQLEYRPGQLKAVAYDYEGDIIAQDWEETFHDAYALQMKPDKTWLTGDGRDLCFIEINASDKTGRLVKNANNEVTVEVQGAGRLVGLDNGDSTDFTAYKGSRKRMFRGKLLAIIAPYDKTGNISITVRSVGLSEAQIDLTVKKAVIQEGANDYFTELLTQPLPSLEKVPVRKILLDKAERIDGTYLITAECLPKAAQKPQLFWRLTDEKGIDSDIGEVIEQEDGLIVKPQANGTAIVRCGVKNGKKHLDFYETLPLAFSGLKDSKLNPYKPISGGRYTRSNVQLTNGNERGIATLRDGTSWVVFDDIDFGKRGANQMTLSLFPLEPNPFEIEIYQGYPTDSDSQLMTTVIYDRGSVWNTYQEQTYQLPNRLSGVQTMTFSFKQKVHFKEFVFEPYERSFEKVSVLENDGIYGDSFVISERAIEQIGNNVTLTFTDFNFGESGASAIEIRGEAPKNDNSIQIKVSSAEGTERYLLDFPAGSLSQVRSLAFEHLLKGKQTVEFIFLPGSFFNFEWFRFMPTDVAMKKHADV